jgi:hypothetical protein
MWIDEMYRIRKDIWMWVMEIVERLDRSWVEVW